MMSGMQRRIQAGTSEQQVGKTTVPVAVGPRLPREKRPTGGIRFIVRALTSLVRGMRVTIGYFLRPATIVTQQYPENRSTLVMFDRFRGQLELTKDDQGIIKCNGCNFCGLACPNGTITVRDRKNALSGTSELDQFIWRLDSCTFCNACVQACPHDALAWSQAFEAAVFERRLLIYGLNTYAGPPSAIVKRAEKKQEDVAALKATAEERQRYAGELPLAGTSLPGAPAFGESEHMPQ